MDLIQTSNKYLNTLYLKSKDDFVKGFSHKAIDKLLGLDNTQAVNAMKYLVDKKLIATQAVFDDNLKLTSSGIGFALKLRENKLFKTIKFKSVKYLESAIDAIEFLYWYDLIDEKGKKEPKTIKVSISGSLSIRWGFRVWSNQPNVDYPKLEKILLYVGKDKVIEELKKGTLKEQEELNLSISKHPLSAPYNPDNLIEPQHAEFEIEVGEKISSEEIK